MFSQTQCSHPVVRTTPSDHAKSVGYKPRTTQQLFTAATGSRKRPSPADAEILRTHPAPLILPGDDLACDPKYPPQSFMTWLKERERNAITPERQTVYVAEVPTVDQKLETAIGGWDVPGPHTLTGTPLIRAPRFDDVLAYLQAFFHGMPVRKLLDIQQLTMWSTSKSAARSKRLNDNKKPPDFIGIASSKTQTVTRVRTRHLTPDDTFSPYAHQLNLDDLLDHAINVLPSDAYALLLLVNHDLYEDQDDDFCVGRAYGGSRVAVVSSAQYQPALDSWHNIDITSGHIWPASHCERFLRSLRQQPQPPDKERKADSDVDNPDVNSTEATVPIKPLVAPRDNPRTPLQSAIDAHRSNFDILRETLPPSASLQSIYTRRLLLTASHELLHCFGLDHCIYLACAMQGTASIAEDNRQPPYLCPICENKFAFATACEGGAGKTTGDWWNAENVVDRKTKRNKALAEFCESMTRTDDLGFASLGAWYRRRLEMEESLLR